MLHNIIAEEEGDPIDAGLLDKITKAGQESLDELIVNVLNIAIGAAAVICVVMLIVAGYSYITASGDETKIEKATKTLTNSIIGLVICFVAVLLVNFVLKNVLDTTGTGSLLYPFLIG